MKLAILLFVALAQCALLEGEFDLEAYKGKWFELARTKNTFFETGEKVQTTLNRNSAGGYVAQQSSVRPNGSQSNSVSVIEPVGDAPGHFYLYYPRSWFSKLLKAEITLDATLS